MADPNALQGPPLDRDQALADAAKYQRNGLVVADVSYPIHRPELTDYDFRSAALTLALDHLGSDGHPSSAAKDIVEAAKLFEAYLRGN